MTDIVAPAPAGKYMVDTYENWARAEGVPVHEAFALDLATLATKPWPRMGVNGAFCHLAGRCDYLTMWLLDIAANGKTAPQRHMFEALFYVVSGHGTVSVESADGKPRTFDVGPRSVFAVPMNARYQLTSAGGARVAVISDMRYILNLFRSETFLFANPARFPDRGGDAEQALIAHRLLETSLVPDVAALDLGPQPILRLQIADAVLGAHVSELAAGASTPTARHFAGVFTFIATGSGYTTHWFEGEPDVERIEWRPGVVYAPGLQMSHQRFNTGKDASRALTVQYGSMRFPMAREKAQAYAQGADIGAVS